MRYLSWAGQTAGRLVLITYGALISLFDIGTCEVRVIANLLGSGSLCA